MRLPNAAPVKKSPESQWSASQFANFPQLDCIRYTA